MRVLSAVVRVAVLPGATARALIGEGMALRLGLIGFVILAAMYTFTVAWGWWHGFGAAVEPWVPIAAEDYYFYEIFFAAPVYFLVLIVFAGTTRLTAQALGGRGTFETLVGLLGLSMVLPTFAFMWLPETILMVLFPGARATELGGFAGVPPWLDTVRQLAVPAWMLVIDVIAVSEAERLGAPKSTLAVVTGLFPATVLAVTWIR